jgi:hypothetical protein
MAIAITGLVINLAIPVSSTGFLAVIKVARKATILRENIVT